MNDIEELKGKLSTIKEEVRKLEDIRVSYRMQEYAIRKELFELQGPQPCPVCGADMDQNDVCDNPECPDYVPF